VSFAVVSLAQENFLNRNKNGGQPMRKRCDSVIALFLILILASIALAQRPRGINDNRTPPATSPPPPPPPPAPQTVKAKYEGGVFGYPHKMDGTLTLDDANNRLLFRNAERKEVFSIPYAAITGAYGDSHAVRPAAATVGQNVPYIGLPIGLIKTKVRYLTLQYSDPDSKAAGVTSFRLENKDLLASVLNTLAGKAELTKRGDVFVKKKE
jgi:hypothetical protein